mgnify:CR=1 FL=1
MNHNAIAKLTPFLAWPVWLRRALRELGYPDLADTVPYGKSLSAERIVTMALPWPDELRSVLWRHFCDTAEVSALLTYIQEVGDAQDVQEALLRRGTMSELARYAKYTRDPDQSLHDRILDSDDLPAMVEYCAGVKPTPAMTKKVLDSRLPGLIYDYALDVDDTDEVMAALLAAADEAAADAALKDELV